MRILIVFLMLTPGMVLAQTYTHPTTGIASTYAGACMVNTCSGTYYDNGGAAGNYAANINAIYRTFCPSSAGMCVRATFTAFSMNDTYFLCGGPGSCCDYLQVLNGPAQNSPALYNNCTTSPGTITSTSPSGCLTFRHTTDGSVQLGGWAATLSCVACAGGPSGTSNQDCSNAVQICADAPFASTVSGPGLASESCLGCTEAGGEVYSSWYKFQVSSSGTLGLTVAPTNVADDYDFALYAASGCGSLGSPVRCSFAAGSGNTGMGGGAADLSEDVAGNGWVSTLPVTAGQVFFLMVNQWSPTASGFTLDWNLTGGASLNCTPLSVELKDFFCKQDERALAVSWTTASEKNSDYFILEKSEDGANFFPLIQMDAQGESSTPTDYIFMDNQPVVGANYYRLISVDGNGERTTFDLTSGNFSLGALRIKTMRIYNQNGSLVKEANGENLDVKTTFSGMTLPDGVYILETVDFDGGVERIKFIQLMQQ
ncbi:MAG: hypothetical protein ACO1N0_02475 [Fluviicola sp.]